MRETRLKIGKEMYERGEIAHPYAVEYAATICVPSKEPRAQKEAKKKAGKHAR